MVQDPSFGVSGYCGFTVLEPNSSTTRWDGCQQPADTTARPQAAAGPRVDRGAVIRQAVLELLVEPGEVGVLPGRALTGLETSFWVDGVGPRQTEPGAVPFGMTIRAWPVGYRWEFGDGAAMSGGAGRASPPRSSPIRHVYQRSDQIRSRLVG